MSGIRHGFAEVGGRRIHYLEAGEGAPLLLLHTGGASAHEYEDAIPLLSASHRVIAWDMPGHGDSDPILSHWSIEDYADALIGFADALGLSRFTVAGASIGGYIAMAAAQRHADRLNHVVLAEAPLRSPEWYETNWGMFEAMCAIPEVPFEALAPRFRALNPDLYRRWIIDRHKAGSWTTVDIAWAVRDFDAAGALTAIAVPMTVVMGAVGPAIPEKDRWTAMRPDAPIVEMAECGHFVMVDDPEGFARILTDISRRA